VKVLAIIEAEQALGHHWGTFRLTNEGVDEPPQELAAALQAAEIPAERFRPLRPGEAWEAPHSLG
jgi:L-ascorbate metabolism protein UlaG (beta-lactamase superfamily)